MMDTSMARVLLSESDPGVRGLLEAVLGRGGHEPLVLAGRRESELPEGDLLVAEPAYGDGLRHAQALRRRDPSLAIILVSILPPESAFLALAPVSYLVKPFSVASLERAVRIALTSPAARRVRRSAHQ
jgi:DNA-binding response OmpR family regulator